MVNPHVYEAYHFKYDLSVRDDEVNSTHQFIDVILNDDYLVTALKDEGAANTFISTELLKAMNCKHLVEAMPTAGEPQMTGMGGKTIQIYGRMRDVPFQIGTVKTTIPTLYILERRDKFLCMGGDLFSNGHIVRVHTNEADRISVFRFKDKYTLLRFRSGDGDPPEKQSRAQFCQLENGGENVFELTVTPANLRRGEQEDQAEEDLGQCVQHGYDNWALFEPTLF